MGDSGVKVIDRLPDDVKARLEALLEPVGYDGSGAAVYAHQLGD